MPSTSGERAIPTGHARLKHRPKPKTASAVRAALRSAGCRYTAQRAAVLAYLETVDNHPTADDVYWAVRDRLPSISLATVYNALEALVAARLATRLTHGDSAARYDCRGEDHYHLHDTASGEIRDLPAKFDPQLLEKLDPRLVERLAQSGFRVTGYRLEVLGRFQEPRERRSGVRRQTTKRRAKPHVQ
ncbi:MAG TPA: transcriptional repressor [Pirellulales bacterium]|jgi:Fe2+ or Zn2+ uptake regulation protein|nr:transcriptional repressor [Pirellulales bacterium]